MVFQCGAATTSGLYVFQLNSMGTATEAVLKVETLKTYVFLLLNEKSQTRKVLAAR